MQLVGDCIQDDDRDRQDRCVLLVGEIFVNRNEYVEFRGGQRQQCAVLGP